MLFCDIDEQIGTGDLDACFLLFFRDGLHFLTTSILIRSC